MTIKVLRQNYISKFYNTQSWYTKTKQSTCVCCALISNTQDTYNREKNEITKSLVLLN